MRCVHSIHFIFKSSFNVFFIHHIHVIQFVVLDQYDLKSQISHWENCWLASISPEFMFVFLIKLTSISHFQSQGTLLFNATGNNFFFPCTRHLAKVWNSLNWNPVFKAFSFNQIIITFTHNQCTWCLHIHCCKTYCT